MSVIPPAVFRKWRMARVGWSLVLAACLCFSGCVNMDALRGDSFPEDENTRLCEQLRPRDKDNDPFVFSNKARQINRHLGGG
jgi:hypothetical protein